ncbi:hypothetical protein CON70_06640 [Bacillus pseudomycoides]|nr:hypothetical protein CON70_06640 [Bacillus pseudomycoides]PDZ70585.1 hypothetical protein CON58_28185 [Bacillus pseudomycoides]
MYTSNIFYYLYYHYNYYINGKINQLIIRILKIIKTYLTYISEPIYGFWCKESLKLRHTDIITLEKVCDQYGKEKFV